MRVATDDEGAINSDMMAAATLGTITPKDSPHPTTPDAVVSLTKTEWSWML